MRETIKVLDIELDTVNAKDAMRCAMHFMEREPINTIEIVAMDTLLLAKENENLKEAIEAIDLVFPGEPEILTAAGVTDRHYVQEISTLLFVKMFVKYLHKNKKKVFILGETKEEAQEFADYLKNYYRGIVIQGTEAIAEETGTVEMIINKINGTETDCVISAMAVPGQELFIAQGRELLNAKLWLGCGRGLQMKNKKNSQRGRFHDFLVKRIFRHQVELEKRK
ncbi:WecB/TagA/CpsF family glycosyltransferase [Hespellia stercorisuis]|uniref:N-acetylglucosaminyldiphosphoundecaprenol N-acetyl-beta-D-mannosaminyltransferase n=1 Tax=Hespellia stercorisuis DSM 15480 TaxID=1121950 RepID=A0A1M6T1V5_9FIRM|nr:WecB/TagA/CpsF family glycosyltransferase [Hespellia stercorisuis]SHK50945.1 N-acetylglucosaminyldiphosphoundecaprenol N-acetyl-beta-D-mannosaminyltransferase [Hespellia stercorisuis DSM 15480]